MKVWAIQDEVFKYEDAYIELIEKFPCLCSEGLKQRMNQIIRETDCLNTKKEEYKAKRKEEKRMKDNQKKRDHYQENKEQIAQKAKEYQQKNKEQIAQKKKEYREANKEQIALRRNKNRVTCVCGGTYKNIPSSKNPHLATKKHQKFEQQEYEQFMALGEDQVKAMLN